MITENAKHAATEVRGEKFAESPKVNIHSSGGRLQTLDDPYKHAKSGEKSRSEKR